MSELDAQARVERKTVRIACICRGQPSCPQCRGAGKITRPACRRCGGSGRTGGTCVDCRGLGWRELDGQLDLLSEFDLP